jgi:hypothetical protein
MIDCRCSIELRQRTSLTIGNGDEWAVPNTLNHRLHKREVQTAVQGRKGGCFDVARKRQMEPVGVPVNKVKLVGPRRE